MMRIAVGIYPSLTQMDQMAAGLCLARASQVIRIDADAVERRYAVNDHVVIEQALIFRGKRIETAPELIDGHEQRCGDAVALPRVNERGERIQIA